MNRNRIGHALNVTYLVLGLVFLGLAGSWALRESGVVVLEDVQWLLPLTLIAAGVAGLAAVAAKSLRRRGRGYADQDEHHDPYDLHYDTEGEIR